MVTKVDSVILSEVKLLLKEYGDIFSSFDARPFETRALSVDFLDELRRATKEKDHHFFLHLFIPANKRNISDEKTIRTRLLIHFKKHAALLSQEKKEIIKEGIWFILAGVVIMFFSTLILFKQYNAYFLMSFLLILLEPAGWFLFWEGLNHAIFDPRKKNAELTFYQKMSRSDIHFQSMKKE